MEVVLVFLFLGVLTPALTTDPMDSKDSPESTAIMENTTSQPATTGVAPWRQALDKLQLAMTIIGLIANIVTIILLWKAGHRFAVSVRFLLRHQSFVDGLICALAIPILLQPFNWTTGNESYDIFMCHIWHSQVFFWSAIYVSVWNLVLIAIERFLAVKHPEKHQHLTKVKLSLSIMSIYVTAAIVLFTGFMQVSFSDAACSFEYFFKHHSYTKYMKFYSIYWFCVVYALPVILFICLYGSIISSLHKKKSSWNDNKEFGLGSKQFTRTAILITIFFVIFLSFDSIYYLLGTIDVATYIHGSRLQRVALFLTCMNSVVNPFLYVLFMPVFRKSIFNLRCRGKSETEETKRKDGSSTDSSSEGPQTMQLQAKSSLIKETSNTN